jgi:hydrogenase nickel incorporation protein HypB
VKQVRVIENVLKLNDQVAAENRQVLREAKVYCIDLIGAPGCGKTALLEATLRRFKDRMRIGVLVGDLTTARDAERMARYADDVVQINTGRGCHLEAHQVRQAMNQLDLAAIDLLVIENVGNLICPVGFDLGQDVKVGMFSVSEGDDKAAKHPYLVHAASIVLLNKMDLMEHVPFDRDRFEADVRQLNPETQLMAISVAREQVDPWFAWLQATARPQASPTMQDRNI